MENVKYKPLKWEFDDMRFGYDVWSCETMFGWVYIHRCQHEYRVEMEGLDDILGVTSSEISFGRKSLDEAQKDTESILFDKYDILLRQITLPNSKTEKNKQKE